MRILVTSPETDNITRYLRAWTKQLLEKAHRQHQVLHLDGEKVTRKHFCGILRKKSINIVCLNGHGADDRILGHRQETLLETQRGWSLTLRLPHQQPSWMGSPAKRR